MNETINKRIISRVIIEAITPLSISSGRENIITDDLILTDVNGLPYIPGTSICGVIRHAVDANQESAVYNQIFGFQGKNAGQGSRIIFSNAKLIGEDGRAVEELGLKESDFYGMMRNLPIRQHAKIGHKGVTENTGKFDQQVIYKGARFVFEIELAADNEEQINDLNMVLSAIKDETLRLGGGTTKGYGAVKIVSLKRIDLDLTKPSDLDAYLHKSSSLNDGIWDKIAELKSDVENNDKWDKYELRLKADNYFIFGSGVASEEDDADDTPEKEYIIEWTEGKPHFSGKEKTIIPASSVKGIIRHRTEYWYRKAKKLYRADDDISEINSLFGYTDKEKSVKGRILINDFVYTGQTEDKLFNHVKIDRFTGGAIAGALYSESATSSKEECSLKIYVDRNISDTVKDAFINTLDQICNGQLALGGMTNRGHGIFKGELFINDKKQEIL